MAAWLTTLDSLPLSEGDKARASVLILKERPEDRQLYVVGTQAQAVARIRELLSQGMCCDLIFQINVILWAQLKHPSKRDVRTLPP